MASPVVPGNEGAGHSFLHSRWGRLAKPDENDATFRGEAQVEGQFAKVFVEGEKNSTFPPCQVNDFTVAHARTGFLNPGHIPAKGSETRHGPARDIFVRQEIHRLTR
jgi:hypothetical protein